VRLTLQPFDAPPHDARIDAPRDDGGMMRLIDQIGSDEMLLFSTDYPHWQFDGLAAMPAGIDAALAKKIMADNPLRTYVRLRQQMASN
jgi:predicted TIM-barrel fold metal-dependent hydrolase